MPARPAQTREVYLDHARVTAMLGVFLVHSSLAYTFRPLDYWHVDDPQQFVLFNVVATVGDCFGVGGFFLLAGYFAPHTLARGALSFVARKLVRIGLPALFALGCVAPLVSFLGDRLSARGDSLVEHWRASVTGVPFTGAYWFLLVLGAFFALTAAAAPWLRAWLVAPTTPRELGTRGQARTLVWAAAVTALAMFAANCLVPDATWLGIGRLEFVQPTRLPYYVVAYALGLLAVRRGQLADPDVSTRWLWLLGAVAALLHALRIALIDALPEAVDRDLGWMALRALLHAGAALTSLWWMLQISRRTQSRPGRLGRELSRSAYAMYLVHQPIVVGLQLLATRLPLPAFIKFELVLGWSLVLCYGLSLALRRLPGFGTPGYAYSPTGHHR